MGKKAEKGEDKEGKEMGRRTRWFVFKLSICLRKTSVQTSLHRNLIMSSVSAKRGRSREKLFP